MTKIDFDIEYSFKSLVLKKEDVVVEGDGLHFWIPFFHAHQRSLHVSHRYGQYAFQEILPHLAVSQCKHDANTALAGDNEVTFHVAQSPPLVDFARSCVDHALADDTVPFDSMSSFSFQ